MIGKLVDIDWKVAAVLGVAVFGAYFVLRSDAKAAASAAAGAAGALGNAVNPLNNKNAASSTVNAFGRAIGDNTYEQKNWTAGGAIFDWLNGTNTTEGDFSTNNPYKKG